MGKRLAIALVLLGAIFGGGTVLYGRLFSQRAQPTGDIAADAQQIPAIDAQRPEELVVVTAIDGQLFRRTPDGDWMPVHVGSVVSTNDALRTVGEGAQATLSLGTLGTTLVISGEFTVPTLTTELSTVEVVDGSIAAQVAPSNEHTLRVEARGSDAIAESRDGTFSVLSTGQGQVAVASRKGAVEVRAAGETVLVQEGSQTLVMHEGPPSPPAKIAASLLLKVGRTARHLRVRETIVRGSTSPGAIVSIGGVRVQANERGEFSTKVALREGRNALTLRVEDSLGRKVDRKLPAYVVDSKGPRTRTGVEW